MPTRVRFNGQARLSAKLVRGVDNYHHFDPEPRPQTDCDAASRAAHERITRAYFASKQELATRYAAMKDSAAR